MADTAARLAISARRNEVARFTIAITGLDMTGIAMAMQIRLGRDVPGAPLIALGTVDTLTAEGLKFDSMTVTNGVPTSIIKGRIDQSTMTDATKVPYMGEVGTDSVFAYAMQWALGGDPQTRIFGDFIVIGSAFGSDNAPASRPANYGGSLSFSGGSSSATLSFGDQVISVSIDGAEYLRQLLGGTVADRQAVAADRQAVAADRAAVAADRTAVAGDKAATAGAAASVAASVPVITKARQDAVAAAGSAVIDAAAAARDAAAAARDRASIQAMIDAQTIWRFVDATTGNDAANGLTAATAWRSGASLEALGAAIAGHPIGLARGSLFGRIALTGDNVRVQAYGDPRLPPPILDSSIALPSTAWVPDAGYAGMFKQTVGGALENASNLGNVVQLDTKLNEYEIIRYFTSRADLNAAPSGAFVDGWGTANLTVYIKPIEGDPRKNGRVYRVANDAPFEITGNNAVVTGIMARNPGAQNGAIKALGYGHVVRNCRFLNGSRHNALIGFDCVVEDNYFGGGANGTEPGIGGGNTLVVFSGSIDKRYMILRRNVHDAREQTFVSGPLWHAGISDADVPSSILMEDEVYIGINTCLNGGVTPPGGLLNYRPRYVTSPGGLVCNIMSGSNAQIYSPTGEANGCHENYAIDVSVYDADLRIPDVGFGRYGFCFVQGITTGGPKTRLIGGEYRIAPVGITNGFATSTSAIASYTAGSFEARNARFVTEGTVLGHLLAYGWNIGHDGGTGTVSGGGNTYPYGVKFAINGTTYPTLAAAQAAGYEPGSTSQQIRPPIATSSFDVPDGTPLENVPGWSLLGGASGTIVVQDGKPRSINGQTAAYKRGELPALGGYVSWKNTGSADYSYACTHVIDRLNFMGAFVTGNNIEAYAFVDGAPRQILAFNNATVPGDRITLAYRVINDATGEMRFWLYVNDATLDVRVVIQPKFAGVRAAGIGSHSASPAILDDFAIGAL